jgi:hypothetical protein
MARDDRARRAKLKPAPRRRSKSGYIDAFEAHFERKFRIATKPAHGARPPQQMWSL